MWEDLVNKGSNFEDFVRFRPHTYTRTQQSLPPLWAAIMRSKRLLRMHLQRCEPRQVYVRHFV